MVVFKFLPGVKKRRALEEIQHRRVVPERLFALHIRADARLVVVLQKAQLIVVCGIDGLLEVQHVEIVAEDDFSLQILVKRLADVVFILHVERFIHIVVEFGANALVPREAAKALVDGLGQPDAVWIHLTDRLARGLPEFQRHERGYVAPEAVDDTGPEFEALDLIRPEIGIVVIEVNDVRPVAHFVAGLSVCAVIEKVRVLPIKRRVRGCMVIHNVDHAFHASGVNFLHERFEIVHRAVGGVDASVVAVRVRAAERSLFARNTDGMDGQEPDDIRAQRADAV